MKTTTLVRLLVALVSLLPLASCGVDPADLSIQLCAERGGRYESRYEKDVVVGYCAYNDYSECLSWAFYRGQCLPGQVPSADRSAQKMRLMTLVADLDKWGVTLTPPSSFWGGNGARLAFSMPSSSSLLFETSYHRMPSELFQIQAVKDATAAQTLQSRIQNHAASFSQPRGFEIDAIRYYRCDDVFVAYIVSGKQSLDPTVDKALSDACAQAFARYPPE